MVKQMPDLQSFQQKVIELSEPLYDQIREKFPLVIEPGHIPRIKI